MRLNKLQQISAWLLLLIISLPSQAVWFEATGQAVIHNGETEAARQQATQEAIKQALLFAGASVKSVQSLANGLLQDDRFEIRAAGEVNSIELIDEIYHSDFVTVSIRADIFPQDALCTASDYRKNIATTWYDINKRQQAAVGHLYDFGKVLAEKIQVESQQHARYSFIHTVEPYYLTPTDKEQKSMALKLAQKADAQYVLFGEILEFAVETSQPSTLAFWQAPKSQRNLTLSMTMFDGNSGERVFQQTQSLAAPWDFDLYTDLDSGSQQLWNSAFGQATQKLIQTTVQKLDESVSCLTSYGRVLNVVGETITINIGTQNGVKSGDRLTLFQMNQFYDAKNQIHRQFQLHPEQVVVKQVFADTALVMSFTGAPLANIQPNDFVARR